jgi:hypothetical protein
VNDDRDDPGRMGGIRGRMNSVSFGFGGQLTSGIFKFRLIAKSDVSNAQDRGDLLFWNPDI